MCCMNESEKFEQIGRLTEECSHTKGKLARINEKLVRAKTAYQVAFQNFLHLHAKDGRVVHPTPQGALIPLEGLLDSEQLIQALIERDRLEEEVTEIVERLKALTPDLF